MPLIDARGRVFGRLNLIDALVVLLVLGLIPLGYGGYVLFRVADVKITSVTPDQVVQGEYATLTVTGQNIRPFIEAGFAAGGRIVPSTGLFVMNSNLARLEVPRDLAAGVYDISMSEKGQPLFFKPRGLTVLPAQWSSTLDLQLQAAGTFIALTDAEARSLAVGTKLAADKDAMPLGEVLAVRAPEPASQRVRVMDNGFIMVPLAGQMTMQAVVRVRCTLVDTVCRVGNIPVQQGSTLFLPTPGTRAVKFVVDEVRPPDARPVFFAPAGEGALAAVRVRFAASAELLDHLKSGEIDVAGSGVVAERDRATLTEIGSVGRAPAAVATVDAADVRRQLDSPAVAFTATLRVPVVYSATGWKYKGRAVKIGAGFQFETIAGIMSGIILDVKTEAAR
jgi:hypothetical protein